MANEFFFSSVSDLFIFACFPKMVANITSLVLLLGEMEGEVKVDNLRIAKYLFNQFCLRFCTSKWFGACLSLDLWGRISFKEDKITWFNKMHKKNSLTSFRMFGSCSLYDILFFYTKSVYKEIISHIYEDAITATGRYIHKNWIL